MPLPLLFIRTALVYAATAMLLGLIMAISKDHTMKVAHAHLAIIGWFGLFSTGMIYRNFPQLAARGGRMVYYGLAGGTALLALGVGLLYYGAAWAEPLASIGSLAVFFSIVWLAYTAIVTDLS